MDITDKFNFGPVDDEFLPITKCICGLQIPIWEFVISIYKDNAEECPNCKRKFYFHNKITIKEVICKEK